MSTPEPRTITPHRSDNYTADGLLFLGNFGNWDLYGDPMTGNVVTIPVVESCRASFGGTRGYFRGTRSRLSTDVMQLNDMGRSW